MNIHSVLWSFIVIVGLIFARAEFRLSIRLYVIALNKLQLVTWKGIQVWTRRANDSIIRNRCYTRISVHERRDCQRNLFCKLIQHCNFYASTKYKKVTAKVSTAWKLWLMIVPFDDILWRRENSFGGRRWAFSEESASEIPFLLKSPRSEQLSRRYHMQPYSACDI